VLKFPLAANAEPTCSSGPNVVAKFHAAKPADVSRVQGFCEPGGVVRQVQPSINRLSKVTGTEAGN